MIRHFIVILHIGLLYRYVLRLITFNINNAHFVSIINLNTFWAEYDGLKPQATRIKAFGTLQQLPNTFKNEGYKPQYAIYMIVK